MAHNYVYLIREREFVRNNEQTYKLGKTTQLPNSRLAGYPKGSEVILFIDVSNCHDTEKRLMEQFDGLYKQKKEYGREYYEGDLNNMKRTFFNVIEKEFKEPYQAYNRGWFSSFIYYAKKLSWW